MLDFYVLCFLVLDTPIVWSDLSPAVLERNALRSQQMYSDPPQAHWLPPFSPLDNYVNPVVSGDT